MPTTTSGWMKLNSIFIFLTAWVMLTECFVQHCPHLHSCWILSTVNCILNAAPCCWLQGSYAGAGWTSLVRCSLSWGGAFAFVFSTHIWFIKLPFIQTVAKYLLCFGSSSLLHYTMKQIYIQRMSLALLTHWSIIVIPTPRGRLGLAALWKYENAVISIYGTEWEREEDGGGENKRKILNSTRQ